MACAKALARPSVGGPPSKIFLATDRPALRADLRAR
jgi:hypothetical protein